MAKISPMMILPPLIFAAIAGLFLGGMFLGQGRNLPSALIGREAPSVAAEGLPGLDQLTDADLRAGEITLLNYWASWCPPCRAEHPTLKALAAEGEERGFRLVGINFRDTVDQALAYLIDEGNPFLKSGFDPRGRTSIDWGVSAPPETFIINGDGTVLYRFAGPLIGSDYEQRFRPELEKALAQARE